MTINERNNTNEYDNSVQIIPKGFHTNLLNDIFIALFNRLTYNL